MKRPSQRKGVSGIVAALILFVMLFTVGTGYFLWVSDNNLSSSQAQAARNNSNQVQQSENLVVVPSVQDPPVTGNTPIDVKVTNTGNAPVIINSILVTDLTDTVLSACPSTCRTGINPGGETSTINTGFLFQGDSIRIKAITESGNVFSTTYMVPTISTRLFGPSGATGSVPAGGSVYDTAQLIGAFGTASGTLTYYLSASASNVNGACQSKGVPVEVGNSVNVVDGVVPNSVSQPFNTPGSNYFWYAIYGGDTNDAPATSPCEPLTVTAATGVMVNTQLSTLVANTGQPVYDTASLSGATTNAGGTVSYYYFYGATCSGIATPVGAAVTVTNRVVPSSQSVTYVAAGYYSWDAVYSGDANNNGATSPCEPLTVLGSETQFPFAVSLNSFRFYFVAVCGSPGDDNPCATPGYNDPAQLGDGFPVGGYYAYVVPSETQEFDVVYQIKVTNVDPMGRSLTLNDHSFVFLCALPSQQDACTSQFESNEYYIIGDIKDSAPYKGGVSIESFTSEWPNGYTIGIGDSALINFTTVSPGGSTSNADTPDNSLTPYLLFPFLEGSYSDGTPFTLTLASTSVFGSDSSFTACAPSSCSGSVGSPIGLTMSGFSSNPAAYWVNPDGTTQVLPCAPGHTCSLTSEWFDIPSTAKAGGYYMVFVTDGTNYAYATVFVQAVSSPTISTSLSAANFGLDPNSASHGTNHGRSGSTSITVTISTTNSNDVIYSCAYTESTGITLSISDARGLTWTSRGTISSSSGGEMECWYAISSGALTGDTITFNAPGNFGSGLNAEVFSVSGANTASPFDPNLASAVEGSGSGSPSSVPVTTTNANDLIVGMIGLSGGPGGIGPGGSFTILDSSLQGSASTADEYQAVGSTQSGLGVSFTGFGSSSWVGMVDAFQSGSSGSTIVIGSSATDTATLNGAFNPTGSITFTVYSDSGCTQQVFSSINPISGSSATSSSFTPTALGTYYWEASYPGDTNNNAASSVCGASGEVLTVNLNTPTISTVVSSNGVITLGSTVTDRATLSNGYGTIAGSLVFNAFSSSSCSGSPSYTSNPIPVTGNGQYTSAPSFKPGAAGTYYWQVTFTDTDGYNAGVTTPCGGSGETLTVNGALVAPVISVSPKTIDSGGSATLSTTTSLSGGTSPYTCQWLEEAPGAGSYSNLGASFTGTCTTTGTPTTSTGTLTATGTWHFELQVTDSGGGSATSNAVAVTVNSAMTAPVITVSPATIPIGQSATLSTTTSFGGGTSPYTCQWLEEAPGAGSYGNLGGSFSCTVGNLPTVPTGTLSTAGTWHFELQVSDSGGGIVTSNAVTVTANLRTTSTAVSCVPSSVVVGQATTCTATVTDTNGAGAVTPTGTVSFSASRSGTFSASTCTLTSGSCSVTFTPSGGSEGSITITGTYGGDAIHSGSAGSSTITANQRTTSLSITCIPGTIYHGFGGPNPHSTTCTITVSDTSPGNALTPTGTVTVTRSNTQLGTLSSSTCTLNFGSCQVTFTAESGSTGTPGTETLTAAYGGDTDHTGSTNTFGVTVD